MRRRVVTSLVLVLVLPACAAPSQTSGVGASPGTPTAVLSATAASGSPTASGPTVSPTGVLYHLGFFAFGPGGKLYSDDCGEGVVLQVTGAARGRVVAGQDPLQAIASSPAPSFGDHGPATHAELVCPAGLVFDKKGRLLVADHGHNRIRRVEADGTIVTIVGAASPPLLNEGEFGGDGGPAYASKLDAPVGLTYDAAGNLYIADRENDRVRVVAPDGTIRTLAGNGGSSFDGDGAPATAHSLDYPLSTVVDADGNVYIADDNQNRIRKVTPDGTMTTVIGDGSFGSRGDGGSAVKAQVNDPQGVALDAAGNLYVSEYGANRIRRIDRSGIVTTFAGNGSGSDEGMGGPAAKAAIPQPGQLLIGPDGALYAFDQTFLRILRIDLTTRIVTVVAGGDIVPE